VDPDPDTGTKNSPLKTGESEEISYFEVQDVLIGGLAESNVTWKSFMEA
jgi:hypothetical protein